MMYVIPVIVAKIVVPALSVMIAVKFLPNRPKMIKIFALNVDVVNTVAIAQRR